MNNFSTNSLALVLSSTLFDENDYIRNYNCVNKNIPNRTIQEYRIDNKEQIRAKEKEYYQNNKEKINQKND